MLTFRAGFEAAVPCKSLLDAVRQITPAVENVAELALGKPTALEFKRSVNAFAAMQNAVIMPRTSRQYVCLYGNLSCDLELFLVIGKHVDPPACRPLDSGTKRAHSLCALELFGSLGNA